jgi:hypothetical protein
MIDKLTKENLQKLGFKENDVNELYNTTGDYNLQCNEGKVFVSKPEDKLYTGIDMYRKIYFTEKNTNFPFRCPDLFDEYFELSLAKFFEKQKAELSIHFDEKTQFGKFILLETNRSKDIIKDTKEYIKSHPNTRWNAKERANNVLETYIQFLDNKLFVNKKTSTTKQEKELTLSELALKYYYEGIFINKENANDYLIGTEYKSGYKLYQFYNKWSKNDFRKSDPSEDLKSKVTLKNKITSFETVYELLPENKKSIAKIEIEKLKSYLSDY